MHREDEDFDVGKFTTQEFGGLQAVHEGHVDVHEDDIGQELLGFPNGFNAIGGFADDFDAFLLGKAQTNSSADNWMIINQQEFDMCSHFFGRASAHLVAPPEVCTHRVRNAQGNGLTSRAGGNDWR